MIFSRSAYRKLLRNCLLCCVSILTLSHAASAEDAAGEVLFSQGAEKPAAGKTERLDPYACSQEDHYDRRVTLQLQSILSLHNTTTPNENEDEVYFEIRESRFTENGTVRSPVEHQPSELPKNARQVFTGFKTHFSIAESRVYRLGEFLTNKAGRGVAELLWGSAANLERVSRLAGFTIGHGEAVAVTVNIQEDDADTHADAKVMKKALAKAAETVAAALEEVYAESEAPNAAALQAVPPVPVDDFLGTFTVVFENRCGFIRTTWIAPSKISSKESNSVSQEFVALQPGGASQEPTPIIQDASVLPTVMYRNDSGQTAPDVFDRDHYDFGAFKTQAELWHSQNVRWDRADMLLQTNGTSRSVYHFKIRATTGLPET